MFYRYYDESIRQCVPLLCKCQIANSRSYIQGSNDTTQLSGALSKFKSGGYFRNNQRVRDQGEPLNLKTLAVVRPEQSQAQPGQLCLTSVMYEYTETYSGRFPSVTTTHAHGTEDDEDNDDDVVSVSIQFLMRCKCSCERIQWSLLSSQLWVKQFRVRYLALSDSQTSTKKSLNSKTVEKEMGNHSTSFPEKK